jgi:hypothetical protein
MIHPAPLSSPTIIHLSFVLYTPRRAAWRAFLFLSARDEVVDADAWRLLTTDDEKRTV